VCQTTRGGRRAAVLADPGRPIRSPNRSCNPADTTGRDTDMVEAVALHHGVCIRPVPGSFDPDADLPCQQGREEAPTLITDTLDFTSSFQG
jgi:hypothetical protein